jgi:glyoxylase-like metal-dependent hydrolase (beta-lactamase superfamily II)
MSCHDPIFFRQLFDARRSALTYVLADRRAGRAVLIDPLPDDRALLAALLHEQGLKLQAVLHTHQHTNDPDRVEFPLEPFGPEAIRMRLGLSGETPPGPRDHPLHDGQLVRFGQETLAVIATPGHTPGSASFLWRDRLFCGDALHLGGCPPCNDPGFNAGAMYDSVTARLFTLPGETLVFPGHDLEGRTVSTIGEERRRNHAFSGQSRESFVNALLEPTA